MTSHENSTSLSASKSTKRLRIFAGPNGSGKSTIIEAIRRYPVAGRQIDFGTYVNADDINRELLQGTFSFASFQLAPPTRDSFVRAGIATGLINARFPESEFCECFSLNSSGAIAVKNSYWSEHLAQLLASLLRDYLLQDGRKMSFETVFSHPSKLAFMQKAKDQGYKIYLYYVATEAAEINVARIKEVRIKHGGHDVSEEKIRARYQRSLELMYPAAELAYQAFFFDNTESGAAFQPEYFAHFKVVGGKKQWDQMDPNIVPRWFIRYYVDKAVK